MRVSMRKIAEVAGVSVATVSQVLGNRPENYCSREKRERIRQVAAELGYRQNIGYKLMHAMPTHTAGVLISSPLEVQELHTHELILGVLSEFGRIGYAAFCYVLSANASEAICKVNDFISRGVEHVVFIGNPCGAQKIIADLEQFGTTYISNSPWTERYVYSNSEVGAEYLFNELKKKCGKNFRYICPCNTGYYENSRIVALKRVFPELTLEDIHKQLLFPISYLQGNDRFYTKNHQLGAVAVRELLQKHPHLEGIAFLNDALAMGGAAELLKMNKKNIMITGFNGDDMAMNYPYPIMTVRHDTQRLIELLVQNAITSEPCKISVDPIVPNNLTTGD